MFKIYEKQTNQASMPYVIRKSTIQYFHHGKTNTLSKTALWHKAIYTARPYQCTLPLCIALTRLSQVYSQGEIFTSVSAPYYMPT